MGVDAIYRNRRARYVDDYVNERGGWIGAILDYGDGLTFGVEFGDPALIIEPDDGEWDAALPMLDPLPGPFVTLSDGTTGIVRHLVEPCYLGPQGWQHSRDCGADR